MYRQEHHITGAASEAERCPRLHDVQHAAQTGIRWVRIRRVLDVQALGQSSRRCRLYERTCTFPPREHGLCLRAEVSLSRHGDSRDQHVLKFVSWKGVRFSVKALTGRQSNEANENTPPIKRISHKLAANGIGGFLYDLEHPFRFLHRIKAQAGHRLTSHENLVQIAVLIEKEWTRRCWAEAESIFGLRKNRWRRGLYTSERSCCPWR